jgi:hypothetical protein
VLIAQVSEALSAVCCCHEKAVEEAHPRTMMLGLLLGAPHWLQSNFARRAAWHFYHTFYRVQHPAVSCYFMKTMTLVLRKDYD